MTITMTMTMTIRRAGVIAALATLITAPAMHVFAADYRFLSRWDKRNPVVALIVEPFVQERRDYYEQRYRERVLRALSQRAAKLGMQMIPIAEPA